MNDNRDVLGSRLQEMVPPRLDGDATSAVTVIEPSRGWMPLKLREIWEYREVLYFLVWRDLKVRYRQTVMGVGWAVAQPLSTALIFTIFNR
jgi:lipopolysaccharide transport system permease protein